MTHLPTTASQWPSGFPGLLKTPWGHIFHLSCNFQSPPETEGTRCQTRPHRSSSQRRHQRSDGPHRCHWKSACKCKLHRSQELCLIPCGIPPLYGYFNRKTVIIYRILGVPYMHRKTHVAVDCVCVRVCALTSLESTKPTNPLPTSQVFPLAPG